MSVFVEARETNGKKGKWTFHSMYVDNMQGGKKREKFKKNENLLLNSGILILKIQFLTV